MKSIQKNHRKRAHFHRYLTITSSSNKHGSYVASAVFILISLASSLVTFVTTHTINGTDEDDNSRDCHFNRTMHAVVASNMSSFQRVDEISTMTTFDAFEEDSAETTEMPFQPYELRPETYMVPIVFALIFVVGVVGNGLLVLVFVRHTAMRNVPNT